VGKGSLAHSCMLATYTCFSGGDVCSSSVLWARRALSAKIQCRAKLKIESWNVVIRASASASASVETNLRSYGYLFVFLFIYAARKFRPYLWDVSHVPRSDVALNPSIKPHSRFVGELGRPSASRDVLRPSQPSDGPALTAHWALRSAGLNYLLHSPRRSVVGGPAPGLEC
jgi:hypothetical protein